MVGDRHSIGRHGGDRRGECGAGVAEPGCGDAELVAAVLDGAGRERGARLEHRASTPGAEFVADVARVDLERAVREPDRDRRVAAGLTGQALGGGVAGAGELDDDEREVGRVGRDLREQLERAVQAFLVGGTTDSAPPAQTASL